MGRKWLEIRCTVAAENEDVVTDFLVEMTGNGATAANEYLDTFELTESQQPTVTLTGYLELPSEEDKKLAAFKTFLETAEPGAASTVQTSIISEEDWADNWKVHFRAVEVGDRIVVAPPWEEVPAERIVVRIDPGMAFGTGGHATTRLCLEAIEALLDHTGFAASLKYRNPAALLDVGTGSGILAIASRLLGVAEVVGIDIDDDAITAAEGNIMLNRVGGVSVSTTPLEEVQGTYDIVMANIIAEELIRLMPDLASRTSGFLILSGILTDKEDSVAAAARNHGFDILTSIRSAEWSCVVCRRTATA